MITDKNQIELIKKRIEERWSIIDRNLRLDGRRIKCNICGHEDITNNFKKIFANCIFGGGILERYVCPICDVIFGPIKMYDLTDEQFNKEYEEIYSIYEEGDTSNFEISAFMSMNPQKNKTYLDFGCGSSPRALLKLRQMGWNNVFGYEPYCDLNYDFIIKDKVKLQQTKFDGIFSNNVIEHFRYPIEDLKFMNSILNTNGIHSHATTNDTYAYEYSRFHLFFFLGKSMSILSKNSDLNYIGFKHNGSYGSFLFSK